MRIYTFVHFSLSALSIVFVLILFSPASALAFTGTVKATNPCAAPGHNDPGAPRDAVAGSPANACASTITWNSDSPTATVFVTGCSQGTSAYFAGGSASGSAVAPWIDVNGCKFDLYATNSVSSQYLGSTASAPGYSDNKVRALLAMCQWGHPVGDSPTPPGPPNWSLGHDYPVLPDNGYLYFKQGAYNAWRCASWEGALWLTGTGNWPDNYKSENQWNGPFSSTCSNPELGSCSNGLYRRTVTCDALNGRTSQAVCTVQALPPPAINLSWSPNPVQFGGTGYIRWTISNATYCAHSDPTLGINIGVENVPGNEAWFNNSYYNNGLGWGYGNRTTNGETWTVSCTNVVTGPVTAQAVLTVTDPPPYGWHDNSSCSSVAAGWTCDPSNFSEPLAVHVYRDGPAGSGTFVGAYTASDTRSDVASSCGGYANHGYNVPFPDALRDGQTHTYYTYAIDTPGGQNNPLLSGSPKSVSCPAPIVYTLTASKSGTGTGTVTSSPAGINCGSSCSASFNQNTSVTLSATANPDSSFLGWMGEGCTGTGTCSVTMSQARSVTAVFALNVNGSCAATHFNCSAGTSTNNVDGSTAWTWSCAGSNGGTTASCAEAKPDLVAGSVSPTAATAGTPASFSATISNSFASTGGSFSNFFQVATAANGGGTITDLAASTMGTLAAGGSAAASSPSYTFSSAGTYSVRACADKSSSGNTGVINEANENNNCGAWTTVTVSPITPTGSLTLSPTSCVIAAGESTCSTVYATWTTTNAVAPALVDGNTGATLSTQENMPPPGLQVWVAYPQTVFNLKDGATTLDTDTATATCAAGSSWNPNSGKCVGNAPSGTISASPNPCPVALGGNTCSTGLTWNTNNVPNPNVYSGYTGGTISTNSSGSNFPATAAISGTTFSVRNSTSVLNSVVVTGQCQSPYAYSGGVCTACGNGGCTGTPGGSSGNPNGGLSCVNGMTPPSCTPPAPTVTLLANPTTIDNGQTSLLTWTSTNATSCNAPGSFSGGSTPGGAISGSYQTPPLTTTQDYQMSCTGAGGTANSNIATVIVLQPQATLRAVPARVHINESTSIKWSATQVQSCSVSGPGLSPNPRTDYSATETSQTVVITSQSTYTITCETNGEDISESIIVNIAPDFQEF